MDKVLKSLEESGFFAGISETGKASLAGICSLKQVGKKDILFHEAEQGDSVYLLVSGAVQLHKTSAEGKEVVIKVIRPGEVFAEVILFEEDCYPVTATAIASSEVLVIPKQGMNALLDREAFRNDFISMLMKKQRYLSARIQYLTSHDVEERFRLFLIEHYGEQEEISCSLSKKDIAAAVGTTPESLSRLILRLKDRGLLSWESATIRVDPLFWKAEE